MYEKIFWFSAIVLILSALNIAASKEKFEKPCDEDWVYLDDYCYWSSYQLVAKNASATPLANWFGAQLYCLTIGANLVHFSNDFEKGLISSMSACNPSWLGLVLKRSPDQVKAIWSWWGTCDDASHLVTKFEPNCGTRQPTVARLDPKGVIVADYPDTRLPFVCKKFAYPVDKECIETTTDAEQYSSEIVNSAPNVHFKQLVTDAHKAVEETTIDVGITTDNILSTDADSDHSVTSQAPMLSSDATTYSEEKTSMGGSEMPSTETATTIIMTTDFSEMSSTIDTMTTSTVCRRKCSTGFLDDDDDNCCQKRLNRRDVKRFYDEKTGKCYYVPMNLTAPVDYFSAQLECQEQRMHLVSVHSAEENHVAGFLSLCQQMWIGLENVRPQDVCNCHGWAWEDFSSKPLNNSLCSDYTHNFFNKSLVPVAPVCSSSSQCVYIYPQSVSQSGNQYYWKNCFCYDLQNFMCVDQQQQ